MILEKTIKEASLILKNNNISSHELDAEIILSNIMGVTKEFIITNNNIKIPQAYVMSRLFYDQLFFLVENYMF